jgi:NAD(P)H-hydrate epimerase
LQVLDIGVPPGLSEEAEIDLEMLTASWVADRLPIRPLNSHKGTFGHALVVAGSRQYVGAAYLAAQASVRTGAGLTTLASPRGVSPIVATKSDEAIHFPLPEDAEGRICAEAAALIQGSGRRYSAMAVGSGLGWSVGTTEFLERLLCLAPAGSAEGLDINRPTLIDADGLNNLSQLNDWPQRVVRPLVLTPHPGEMSTLTGLTVNQVQHDRVEVAREWSVRWNACVVLKGAHTVIARPEGLVHVSPFANPGLASGGTGDVLSGVIVALLAQGLAPGDAACCGVWLHALAAGSVTERLGSAGAAASDLLDALPRAIASLRHANKPG